MAIKIYTLEQREEWDSIVRTFKEYDTYWLSGYVKAFHIHGDGEPLLFFYEESRIRGINVVMKRDISLCPIFKDKINTNEYFDFASPYGYGGWIIEGNETEELFSTYENWCKSNGIISEFVRFHPVIENYRCCYGIYDVIPLGNSITMDLTSPEVIWSNITSKNRNMIRKAIKNGVVVYSGRYPAIFEQFLEIYNRTMEKVNSDDYYYFSDEFYQSIQNDLSYNSQVFYAVYDNKVIAVSLILTANGRMNYHLSGSMREYSSLAPTNLLLYEVALWGCANGFKTFYLGGGVGSKDDNLYKFKKAFYNKDEVKRFFIGKKIYIPEKYDELLLLRGEIHSGYFPEYRT